MSPILCVTELHNDVQFRQHAAMKNGEAMSIAQFEHFSARKYTHETSLDKLWFQKPIINLFTRETEYGRIQC
jgi:hypothetical protein